MLDCKSCDIERSLRLEQEDVARILQPIACGIVVAALEREAFEEEQVFRLLRFDSLGLEIGNPGIEFDALIRNRLGQFLGRHDGLGESV